MNRKQNYFIAFLLFSIFLSSCKSPKQLFNTSVEVDKTNELILDVTINNNSDTLLRTHYQLAINIENGHYYKTKAWLINEDHKDTIYLNRGDACMIIDPETWGMPANIIEPNKSQTFRTNFSGMLDDRTIVKGNYKIIVEMKDWIFPDTTFYEEIKIKKDIHHQRRR